MYIALLYGCRDETVQLSQDIVHTFFLLFFFFFLPSVSPLCVSPLPPFSPCVLPLFLPPTLYLPSSPPSSFCGRIFGRLFLLLMETSPSPSSKSWTVSSNHLCPRRCVCVCVCVCMRVHMCVCVWKESDKDV